jgi:O-acetyl-ADP-ribose deacetylase (regulator of RNase III)
MITYLPTGNITFDTAQALVNPVNCVGTMGAGVALLFKRAFPGNFAAYRLACNHGEVVTGKVLVYQRQFCLYIINFPTKQHWRDPSRLEWIVSGLNSLADSIKCHKITSVALPALGCGHGGLDWRDVRPLIDLVAHERLPNVDFRVYEPQAQKKSLTIDL